MGPSLCPCVGSEQGRCLHVSRLVEKFTRLVGGIGACIGRFRMRSAQTPPHELANICTTGCLLIFLWCCAGYTQSRPLAEACVNSLCANAAKVVLTLPEAMRTITLARAGGSFGLQVGSQGSVAGFPDMIQGCFSAKWQTSLRREWDSMRGAGVLDSRQEFFGDSHNCGLRC